MLWRLRDRTIQACCRGYETGPHKHVVEAMSRTTQACCGGYETRPTHACCGGYETGPHKHVVEAMKQDHTLDSYPEFNWVKM